MSRTRRVRCGSAPMARAAQTGSTFVEPDDRDEDAERFHRFAPELDFTDGELRVNGPRDEFDLTLILRNETERADA